MKFQILQSSEWFLFDFQYDFFEKVTDAWVSELSSPLGSKIGPVSRTIFSHIWWIFIYFLISVPEFGHLFRSIFWTHQITWFWSWMCPKEGVFLKNCGFFFRKNDWLSAPSWPKIGFVSGASLGHVLQVSFWLCWRVFCRARAQDHFQSHFPGREPHCGIAANSMWQKIS